MVGQVQLTLFQKKGIGKWRGITDPKQVLHLVGQTLNLKILDLASCVLSGTGQILTLTSGFSGLSLCY